MDYRIKDGNIEIIIPAANAGKLRFKKRDSNLAFGETFSTRTEPFDEKTYLEWQIGFDVLAKEVQKGEAETKLNAQSFIGSNGKEKYPYELSELFFSAIEQRLISRKDVGTLLDEISAYRELIDEKAISVEEKTSTINLNGIRFEETCIKLPTLFMIQPQDGTQIEVAIKQQQYASGVQPMVYFCIPLKSFKNWSSLLGRPSVSDDKLVYMVNKNNVENLSNLMKVFGMASERHQHDIIEIIKVILKLI